MSEIIYHDLRRSAGMVPSLSAQVAREIGSRVIAGVYPPGDLIEGEASLSVRYKVSRSVIRDAVKLPRTCAGRSKKPPRHCHTDYY